ncbi:UDP-N-acetylmuramate dehydrogenase [Marinibactrum halimedae]|uniref:UDP-N-acetylenolpyruvoylglucosamine reductase n=1 Tax=Marinibactrum halimedae TaxID=1444977 RepID=A0AA37T5Z7_9GAMM|nr:UDP-N-acetylmuramate dehydrogenase [Marinibactrum halimedae]MCD9460048.1 UDP-N-acetylmuramate dehydrogenase [Marinibactrum halimedae]GLS26446.1 UDP-N-acetylenolpyruvoylglucosamine reductase [Marinibactrum halimedae]
MLSPQSKIVSHINGIVVGPLDLLAANTLRVPCSTWNTFFVDTVEGLQSLLPEVRHQPLLVLGGGSNVILKPVFPGVALLMRIGGIDYLPIDDADVDSRQMLVKAGAGVVWDDLVSQTVKAGWSGLENLSLIPGTVGAAPIQNIGAYGVELDQVFHALEAVRISDGQVVRFSKEECGFGYRHSVFKEALKGQFIITSVTFRLTGAEFAQCNTRYAPLNQYLDDHSIHRVTPEQVRKAVCDIRSHKLPDPAKKPNVGSFFKNPVIDEACWQALHERFPSMVSYPQEAGQVKLAAGWLIDQAGWKGRVSGRVMVHDKQALVLVNHEAGSADDILSLAEEIKNDIRDKFGVTLEIEPQVYPQE